MTFISKAAKIVTDAYFEAYEIEKLTDQQAISIPEAYLIQDEALKILFSRGDALVGWKMGLTSKAKMKQMGVDSPIYGALTRKMQIQDGAPFSLKGRIHPKIEPEIAFMIGEDLKGKPTEAQALAACSGVCAAMEIIDSRYKNFNFTLPDVIADNCSSSAFVLGKVLKSPRDVDLGNLGMVLEQDGKAVQFGSSAAIYGNPATSLCELVYMLSERGLGLKKGQIVLAGAATAAIAMGANSKITLRVKDLGTVSVPIS
jgi:2-oxo-3-hexenedioate decarboxylase